MIVDAIIEIPTGSRYKYEIKNEQLTIDRILDHHVPFNYGYIPDTLAPDNDPLDIFVLSADGIVPGAKVKANVIGAFRCVDNGESDDKLVAILEGESSIGEWLWLLKSYLANYKPGFVLGEFVSKDAAIETYLTYKLK